MLVDRQSSRTLAALQLNLNAVIAQSSEANKAGHEHWWRPLEAAFAAFGSVGSTVLELISDERAAGRQPAIDVTPLLVNVVPSILTQSRKFRYGFWFSELSSSELLPAEYSFMQGRAFVLASQFSTVLPDSAAGQYIDAVISVLEAGEISIPVKVSAVRAIQGYVISLFHRQTTLIRRADSAETVPRQKFSLVPLASARAWKASCQLLLLTPSRSSLIPSPLYCVFTPVHGLL